MKLSELASFYKPRDAFLVRQERIKREGSRYYTWPVPATAAAATSVIYVPDEFPDSRKYQPLDWLEIVNNEVANSLTLTINNRDTFVIPAGVIRTISNQALWHLAVTNDGAGITTLGNVVVSVRKEPLTIDQWARSQK
jgi:hypothetical protein